MNKIRYLLGIFVANIIFVTTAKVLIDSSKQSESFLTPEWLGLILLSFIGAMFLYRSTVQIKKIQKIQKELTIDQALLADELEKIGEKNA